jgi:hypothetical protein
MTSSSSILLSALVSGAVAVVVASLTALLTVRSQTLERKKQEAQLKREMTKMLYEKRLALYPKAMSLTEPLRKSNIETGSADAPYFRAVLDSLDTWQSGEAGFVISLATLEHYYALRRTLRAAPHGEDGRFSAEQIENVRNARIHFRRSLRNDMHLVYGEEKTPDVTPNRIQGWTGRVNDIGEID